MSAEFGEGWVSMILKIVQDILTQDNGGYIELLRAEGAGPTAPVLGLAHLDSQRVIRTGQPETPIIYYGRTGSPHFLQWYQVIQLIDLPSSREEHLGYGFSAVSRVLSAAQVLRDIGIYKRQKLSGKRIPGIIFASGVRRNSIKEAVDEAMEEQRQEGLSVYTKPIIVSSPDSSAPVDAKLIELAGLPDGYNEDSLFKWYIATLAMGFGTDYTEFAPLPGGNLGSGQQTAVMAAKSRGKGPGLLLQLLEYAINWYVLPSTVEFQFSSSDPMALQDQIALRHLRARERSLRITSGELTAQQALELAVLDGDAPEKFLLGHEDLPPEPEDSIEQVVRQLQTIQKTYSSFMQLLRQRGIDTNAFHLPAPIHN